MLYGKQMPKLKVWLQSHADKWPLVNKFATLAGGTALAQVASLATVPILSRICSPEDFGALAVFLAITSLLNLMATARYDQAIPLPAKNEEALGVVGAAVSVLLVSDLGLALILTILECKNELVPSWFLPVYPYKWLLPLTVLGAGLFQILSSWALRYQAYKSISTIRIRQGIGTSVVSVVGSLALPGAWGLLLGQVTQQWLGITGLFKKTVALQNIKSAIISNITTNWSNALKGYASFAAYATGAGLFNLASLSLPPLIITSLYDQSVTGSFSFAHRLVALPMYFVGSAVSQVFTAEGANALRNNSGDVKDLFKKTLTIMSLWAVVLLLGGCCAPLFFPIIFGPQWEMAGKMASWLALPCAAQLIVSPVSGIAVILKRQKSQFWLDLFRLLAICLCFAIAKQNGITPENATKIFSLTMAVCYLTYLSYYYYLSKNLNGRAI